MKRDATIVRIAIGAFLLLAAGLKFYSLGQLSLPSSGWLASPWLQFVVAE